MGVERSCSSLTRPLPSCGLSLSHMWSRAVPGHGSLSQPFCSAALSFLLCMGEGNWGVDLRIPAFHQPTQVLHVVLSCIPWNQQRSEEGNGVVEHQAQPQNSWNCCKPNSGLLLLSCLFFSFLLQKVQVLTWSCSLPQPCLPLLCGWEDGCDKGGRFSFLKGKIRSRASCWLSRTDGNHTALPSSAG